jgi:hypothetical protein
MKINLLNTPHGLVPLYDDDYEEKKRLKNGEVYEAEIKLVRNYKFHKKFFALINAGFSLLPERTQNGFRSVEGFRAYATVAAGFYEVYYNPRLRQFVEVPKSLAFGSMDEAEFEKVYDAVKNVIWNLLEGRITEQQFEQTMSNF